MLGLRRGCNQQIIHNDYTVNRYQKNRWVILSQIPQLDLLRTTNALKIKCFCAFSDSPVEWLRDRLKEAQKHFIFSTLIALATIQLRNLGLSVLAVLVTVVSSVSNSQTNIGTTPNFYPQQQTRAGLMLRKPGSTDSYQSARMLNSRVHFTISGMVSNAIVTQSFRNDTHEWVEAMYVIPLPEKSTVNHLRIAIGERLIEGHISEFEHSKGMNLQTKNGGYQTRLLNQLRPNTFATAVTKIGPGETVVVDIEYLQMLEYKAGEFTLRFPMTMTSENVREASSVQAVKVKSSTMSSFSILDDEVGDSIDNPISISANIDVGMPIKTLNSTSHEVTFSPAPSTQSQLYVDDINGIDHSYTVQLKDNAVSMDRDFVLSWRPDVGTQPGVAVFSEHVAGDDYAVVMILPPSTEQHMRQAKEMIYIMDTSGSMSGVPMRRAKQAIVAAMKQLGPEDRFNIIEFNSNTRLLFPNAKPALQINIDEAIDFVSGLQAHGSTETVTEIGVALTDAMSDFALRQVMFITDGAIGNEDALYNVIHEKLGSSRLFTVAIGSEPSSGFMRNARRRNSSFTLISSVNQVQEEMTSLFKELDSAIVGNISISWPGQGNVESYPKNIPDLYHGKPLMISAKIADITGNIIINSAIDNNIEQPWHKTLNVPTASYHSGIATLWAREKISNLLDENIQDRDAKHVRSDVLSLALKHQLLSPYTSLVVVEKTAGHIAAAQNVEPKSAEFNTHIYSQVSSHLSPPNTVSGFTQARIYGISFLLMAVIFFLMMRRDERQESMS